MKAHDKIDVLNLIINEIKQNGQNKLNVITFMDLEQLFKKAIDKLNKNIKSDG